jgi:hypothetical protein
MGSYDNILVQYFCTMLVVSIQFKIISLYNIIWFIVHVVIIVHIIKELQSLDILLYCIFLKFVIGWVATGLVADVTDLVPDEASRPTATLQGVISDDCRL